MQFEDYTPNNFDMDKMNPFKFLYLYRRKQYIFRQLLDQINLSDPDDFRSKKPVSRSFEYLQQESGMSTDDLDFALTIGSWIDEYDQMINMDDLERLQYIEDIEQDIEIPEDLQQDFEELYDGISNMFSEKRQQIELFQEIINDNFNNQKEWPDS